jgi:predicted transposase/invertase (TIGR01784 family)
VDKTKVRSVRTKDGKFLMIPKNDYAFKKIFGDEANSDILISLLNSILDLSDDEIESIEFMDRALEPDYYNDKLGMLDIRCKTKLGTQINVEMQLINNHNMDKRILFYWSRVYSGQLKSGHWYSKLNKTVTISILDFEYLSSIEKMHSTFHLIEDETRKLLTDIFEIHIIELPKLYKQLMDTREESKLKNWMQFVGSEDEEVLQMLAAKDEKIKKAYTVLTTISQDEIERREYEAREMQLYDEISRLEDAKEEGLKKGIEEGIEKGIENGIKEEKINTAKKLLEEGAEVAFVVKITGLSEKEVLEPKNR